MRTILLPLPTALSLWILTLAALFCSTFLKAQITVQKYPREITCDIDAITELPTVQAESVFGGLVVHLEEEIFSGGCLGTLVRTFHFEDKAGEKATAIQTVHLTDIMPPDLIGVPGNISVKKDEIPLVFPIDARDNSGQFCEVKFTERQEGNKIFRTWSATDPCGNQNSATQILTIR
jgi:large repetitive protein